VADAGDVMEEEDGDTQTAVVLHEDKKYYPDADEIYPDAETMVQVRRQLRSFRDSVRSTSFIQKTEPRVRANAATCIPRMRTRSHWRSPSLRRSGPRTSTLWRRRRRPTPTAPSTSMSSAVRHPRAHASQALRNPRSRACRFFQQESFLVFAIRFPLRVGWCL
jgi:hypothetical protein